MYITSKKFLNSEIFNVFKELFSAHHAFFFLSKRQQKQ